MGFGGLRTAITSQTDLRRIERERICLSEMVRLRTRQLNDARREVIERLARAGEFRDGQTGRHTRRVGLLAGRLALAMGEDQEYAGAITSAALLHDIGKIGIPDSILMKPGPLTKEERTAMEKHTHIGAAILRSCAEPIMEMAHEIALTHHERWDGRGYPNGLMGDDIPLCGRIVAVADSFDAMMADRPYKAPMRKSDAIDEILCHSGRQFDPKVVKAFIRVQQTDFDFDPHDLPERPGRQLQLVFD